MSNTTDSVIIPANHHWRPDESYGWYECSVELAYKSYGYIASVTVKLELWWNASTVGLSYCGWWIGEPGKCKPIDEVLAHCRVAFGKRKLDSKSSVDIKKLLTRVVEIIDSL